jgi:CheY-like chemotaxis protein
VAQALEVLKQDDQIDQEFDGLLRKLITYMMEDPRTISSSIDLVFVAKAIERVGDHAKNLAEATIYVVKGTDVRHHTLGGCRECGALGARGYEREQRAGGRRRIGDRRTDCHQPAPRRHEVTVAADADQAQVAVDRVLPDLVLLDWMLPGQSGMRARQALAQRRTHARDAGDHAHRACRGGRQDHRPGRRRRRLPDQAVLHQAN